MRAVEVGDVSFCEEDRCRHDSNLPLVQAARAAVGDLKHERKNAWFDRSSGELPARGEIHAWRERSVHHTYGGNRHCAAGGDAFPDGFRGITAVEKCVGECQCECEKREHILLIGNGQKVNRKGVASDEEFMRILLIVAFAAACLAAEPESIDLPRHILTNDGLVVLARAGVGDGLLVDLIRFKRTHFDTSADALALLARHGLSESVLRAVVEKQEQVQLRKPRLTLTPMTGTGTLDVDGGDMLLLPPVPARRRGKAEPDRWYKVSMR